MAELSGQQRQMGALRDRAALITDWPPLELTAYKSSLSTTDYGLFYVVYADVRLAHDWKDVQIHALTTSTSADQEEEFRPLVSGIPNSTIIGGGAKGSRAYAWPIAKDATVSLNLFTALFKRIQERVEPGVKSIMLAICDTDSTVVYYTIHEGVVKPNPN